MATGVSDYTLSEMRALIDPSCFSTGASSTQQNSDINKARELIYFQTPGADGSPIWNGLIAKAQVAVTKQFADSRGFQQLTITLPRQYTTAVVAFDSGGPIPIRNNWQVFGNVPTYGLRTLDDYLDGWCGATNINALGAKITNTTTSSETGGLTLQLFGTDVNGNSISETMNISTGQGTTLTSANTYYSITEVVKSVTAGNLVVAQVTGGVSTPYANYQPTEQVPNYRRYAYNFNTNATTCNVKCKRRLYPLTFDTDLVEFTVTALEAALKAYRAFCNADYDGQARWMADAIGRQNAVENTFQSETAYGAQQIDEFAGFAFTPNLV